MPTTLTREELDARRIEREARRLMQLEAQHEALGNYIAVLRMNLRPTNANLLWAEWHYAKALNACLNGDDPAEYFQVACENLNVDEEGEDVGPDWAAYNDYWNDVRMEDRLSAQPGAGA